MHADRFGVMELRSFYPILGLLFCDILRRGVHISPREDHAFDGFDRDA
jgi:hypothetical protein